MKIKSGSLILIILILSCSCNTEKNPVRQSSQLNGTWQLLTGTTIDKGVTTVTDYTKNLSFIKIINDSHFAFLQHDLKKGKDSAAVFVAGGGRYSLKDSLYTEHLEYCSDRQWEGNNFNFTIKIIGDTLIIKGVEKVENIGVDRINIEKYIRTR